MMALKKSKSDVPLKKPSLPTPKMKSSIPPDAVKLADRASSQNSSGRQTPRRRVRKVTAVKKTVSKRPKPAQNGFSASPESSSVPLPPGGIRELIGNTVFSNGSVGAIVLSSPTCGEGKFFLNGKFLYAAEKNKYVPPILLRMRTEGALTLSQATELKNVPLRELESTLLRDYEEIHPLYFDMLKQQLIFSTLSSFVTWEEDENVMWEWHPGEATSLLVCEELERSMALLAVEERLGQWTVLERNYSQVTESDTVPLRGPAWAGFADEEVYSSSFTHVVRKVNGKTTVRLLAKRSGLTPFEVASILAKAVNDDIVTFEEDENPPETVDAAEELERPSPPAEPETEKSAKAGEEGIFRSVEVEQTKPSAKDFISEEDEHAKNVLTDIPSDSSFPDNVSDMEIEYVDYGDMSQSEELPCAPTEVYDENGEETSTHAEEGADENKGLSTTENFDPDAEPLFPPTPVTESSFLTSPVSHISAKTLKQATQDTLKMLLEERTRLEKALQYNAYVGGVIEGRLSSVDAGIDMIRKNNGWVEKQAGEDSQTQAGENAV